MRHLALFLICFIAIAPAQSGPTITTAPLSKEQTAVYRVALLMFDKSVPYDVINLTGTLRPDEGDYAGCMKGFPSLTSHQFLHRLRSDFADTIRMNLISPELAAAHPFPSGTRGSGVYSMTEPPPPPEHLEPVRDRVILSEIMFDPQHHKAALNVSVIGPGFAHAETHVYKLKNGKWLLDADCGSGIS